MTKWQEWLNKNCERLEGKTIILTGSTGDIGNEIAKHILFLGGNLILAVRNTKKAEEQREKLLENFKDSNIKILQLDISLSSSIEKFVKNIEEENISPNHLICNAGIFMSPKEITEEGNEIRYATNFWGNILLSVKMLPILNKQNDARIVFQSSISSIFKSIDWNDLQSRDTKSKLVKYSRSKRLLHLGAKMLSSYSNEKYPNVKIVLTHPGVVASNMTTKGLTKFIDPIANFVLHIVLHKAATAALGAVYALSAEENEYVVPRGILQVWGMPKKVKLPSKIYNENDIKKINETKEFKEILDDKVNNL